MTIHVAMNIANKDKMYAEALRVIKPGGIFAVYDVLQGEGGEVLYPVPWARDPSISHLATPVEMKSLLVGAGFKLLNVQDSTEESQSFFERMTAQMAKTGVPPVAWRLFLGDDFPAMARNQVRNVTERRITSALFALPSSHPRGRRFALADIPGCTANVRFSICFLAAAGLAHCRMRRVSAELNF